MSPILPHSLYQQDFVAWLDDTVAQLKAGNFAAVDIDHLIEEIEGLAGRDRRELKNRLRVLLAHLLKRLDVDSPQDYRGWDLTIQEQRDQLRDLLEQSPSLRHDLVEILPRVWPQALANVEAEYPQVQFAVSWQFGADSEALLTEKFW